MDTAIFHSKSTEAMLYNLTERTMKPKLSFSEGSRTVTQHYMVIHN